MTTPQQHDDPLGDGMGKVLQALAVFTTVGEAAARFRASGAQNRAAKAERAAGTERIADAARRQADQTTQRAYATLQRADRQLMDRSFDPVWLSSADIHDLAVLWRTSTIHAMSGDKRATEAMRRAEEALRQVNPGLMVAFDRHRHQGHNIPEAMRAAANDTWEHQTRTAATGTANPAEPRAGGLDEATRAELARLVSTVDPQILDQLERQWRGTGHIPAADAAARLADAGRQLHPGDQPDATTMRAGARDEASTTNDRPPPAPPTGREPTDQAPTPDAGPTVAAANEGQAAAQHLTGLADLQQRDADIDEGVADLPGTVADEHRDGLALGQVRDGAAQHDQTGAEQQRRLSRTFLPLGTVNPVFSHQPSPPTSQPATARRRGSIR